MRVVSKFFEKFVMAHQKNIAAQPPHRNLQSDSHLKFARFDWPTKQKKNRKNSTNSQNIAGTRRPLLEDPAEVIDHGSEPLETVLSSVISLIPAGAPDKSPAVECFI